jgi:antitoxin HicB
MPIPQQIMRLKLRNQFLCPHEIKGTPFSNSALCALLTAMNPFRWDGIRMKKSRGHLNIVLRPEPEGGFTAIVPILPGCVTYGRTLAEAKEIARDAISGYIESLKKHKEPIPADDESLVASLELEYAEAPRR